MRRRLLLQTAGSALLLPSLPRLAVASPGNAAAARLGSLQARMPFWGGTGTIAGGYTLTGAFTAEADFVAAQMFWTNMDTVPYVVTAAALAPTSAAGDTANPVNAAGVADDTLWQPATFGGQRSAVLPAAVQGGTGRAAINDRVAGFLLGDVVPVASLPRTDGTLPLLLTRSYSAGPMSCAIGGDVLGLYPPCGYAFDSVSQGRIVRPGAIAGDAASAPGAVQASPATYLAPSGILFHSRVPGLSVMAGGDSLYQGFGTASLQNDPFHIAACAVSTPALPVIPCKVAYQGMPTASFQANLSTFMAAMPPDVAFIKGESPNDLLAGTPAGYLAGLEGLIALGTWCAQCGITPVASTAEPYGETAATEPYRLAYNAQIRSSGWYYADFDAVLSDGGFPAQIQPRYTSTARSPHYNDAGSAAVAGSVAAVLRQIIVDRTA